MRITTKKLIGFLSYTVIFTSLFITGCSKTEKYEVTGTVLDMQNNPVVSAKIEIFQTPEDWLTGHNVLATMSSDLLGDFDSPVMFDEGTYYIFVQKHDTSNWNIRDVENGKYPTITLPLEGKTIQPVEPNNMGLLANTSWKLTNSLEEYQLSGTQTKQWRSVWDKTNNCEKDNSLHFGKDLRLRISEGDLVCKDKERNILGSFVPPIIFTKYSCENLLFTSQKVKPFTFEGWEAMENKQAEMFLACDQGLGQMYIVYQITPNKKGLKVYSRR